MRETRGSILLGRMEWRRYESERRATRMLGVSFEMGISEEKSQTARRQSRMTQGAKELTIFSLWLNLDQHLFLAHHLDHLSNITSGLLQQLQLLPQQPHARVQSITLCLESPEVLRTLVDGDFGLFDLVLVVALRKAW
jgi:hypothetical protein